MFEEVFAGEACPQAEMGMAAGTSSSHSSATEPVAAEPPQAASTTATASGGAGASRSATSSAAPKGDPDDDGDDDVELPLSDLSLSTPLPVGTFYRPLARMMVTINRYASRLTEVRFYDELNLGTVFSAQRRFLNYAQIVKDKGNVELQIGYKQLAERLASVVKFQKAVRAWNDRRNPKALEAAAAPLKSLGKF